MRNLALTPAVYVVDDSSPNAFATGRDPAPAALAVTTGLVDLLDQRELRGVLAHEFAHIRHRDILLTTVAATIARAISALAHVFHFGALFGRHDEEEQGSVLGALALVIVAPLAATLIQLAVSRAREYAADATGARLCGDPLALASALRKVERGTGLRPLEVNPAAPPLFIVYPFGRGGLLGLFSTHPPLAERIGATHASGPLALRRREHGWLRRGSAPSARSPTAVPLTGQAPGHGNGAWARARRAATRA